MRAEAAEIFVIVELELKLRNGHGVALGRRGRIGHLVAGLYHGGSGEAIALGSASSELAVLFQSYAIIPLVKGRWAIALLIG